MPLHVLFGKARWVGYPDQEFVTYWLTRAKEREIDFYLIEMDDGYVFATHQNPSVLAYDHVYPMVVFTCPGCNNKFVSDPFGRNYYLKDMYRLDYVTYFLDNKFNEHGVFLHVTDRNHVETCSRCYRESIVRLRTLKEVADMVMEMNTPAIGEVRKIIRKIMEKSCKACTIAQSGDDDLCDDCGFAVIKRGLKC
ncbi:MAG: hypothetical protein ACTSRA_00790 [Promethearchaeota archaeon]